MEYNMVERAHKLLVEKCSETTIKRQVHDPGAEHDKSGMICAGEQTHAFIPLTSAHLNDITGILECIDSGGTGILSITMKDFHFSGGETSDDPIVAIYNDESSWEYKERIGLPDTVYIFGAGHISVPLSQILRMLNFRVVVFDDRKELSTFKANSYAHHKEIIDYKNIGNLVPEGPNSFVVIMSFGHKSDDVILRQMLAKKLGYLGMIGSKSKVALSLMHSAKKDSPGKTLSRINSPIGIPIGSQTPAEIAISIAAKIILVRNS